MTAAAGGTLATQLQGNLQAQRDCAQQLLDILQAERAALTATDVERLEALTRSKAEAAGLLQKLGATLVQLRGAARMPDFNSWFAQLRLPSLAALWQELLALAEQCQRANLDNAVLLSTREAQLKQTLRAFRPAGAPELYGRSGYAPLDLPPRHFGSA
ncbi:flagella synthesis protein FlgN [Solimonas soli]|uniref:flagella synthesis protein FlgN n=1 Tax=Solimonas soli TaxID=413479 RepID=UPI000487B836|nr:flagellar protein FlgN [Solimonas soli]